MRRGPPARRLGRAGTRFGTVASDWETVNWPTTAAAGARSVRRRSRACAASPGLPPAAVADGTRTVRSTGPPGHRSDRSGTPWSERNRRRWSLSRLLQDDQVAHEVVDVRCAQAGDEVVARPRVGHRITAERHVPEAG